MMIITIVICLGATGIGFILGISLKNKAILQLITQVLMQIAQKYIQDGTDKNNFVLDLIMFIKKKIGIISTKEQTQKELDVIYNLFKPIIKTINYSNVATTEASEDVVDAIVKLN